MSAQPLYPVPSVAPSEDVMWDVHKGPNTVHVVVTWGETVKATVCWTGADVNREDLVAVLRAMLNDESIEDVFTDDPSA